MYNMISLLVLLIIIIVDIFIYKETLTFEFTFDDHLAIENNADVASFDLRYWLHDIWGKDLLEHDSHQSYRPLLITLFQFLWYLSPGSSLLFHFASIYLLLLCSYLVYATFTASNSSIHIVLAASIFFASHPVHIEAVTAVVNMAEPAYSLLSLAAYLAFKIAYSHEYTLINVSYTLVCICCIVLSLLFKETGVVVCVIIAGTIVSRAVVKFLVSISLSKEQQANPFSSIVKLKDIFWIALPSWIVYIYFGFRSLLSHPDRDLLLSNTIETLAHVLFYAFSKAAPSYLNTSQLIRRAENPFAFLTGTEKLLSYLHLYYRYFMLLIYPAEQAAEYSFNCIPSVKSWSDVRAFQSMSMLAAICFLVLYSIKLAVEAEKAALVLPSEADKGRVVRSGYLLMDGLMWLLVSFFPLTGIVFRLGTLLAERLLFLPSVGFCLVQSYLLYHLTKRLMKHMSTSNLAQKTCFYSVAAVIVSFYIQKAREYNPHWKNDASLFLHTVHVCPNSAKSQLQVSKLYSMSINDPYLNLTLAWHHLNRSIEIDPDFCDNDFQRAYLNVLHANTLQLGQSTMLVYDNYISTAIEHLLGNLQCVFTNNKAVELLNKLWAHQVEYTKAFSANKQDTQTSETQLLVKQAKQAYKFQLYSLAAQRFLELGTALYEKNQLQEAIKYTIYADRAIVSYYNFTGKANLTGFANSAIQNFDNMFGSTTSWFSAGQSEALMLYVMQCRAWSLLAGMIHHHYNVSSSLLHQQGKEYASKGSCLECLFVAAKVNKNILEPYHLPMNHIRIASNLQVMQIMKEHGELVGKNYDNVETNVILKYALSLTTLAMLDSNRQLLSQAYSAWNIAASRHYKDNSYVQSSQYYLIALLLGLDPAPLVHIQYYALVVFSSPAVSVDHHSQFFATYNHSMVYNYKKMQDCHSLYLYADSLAGRKELFQSSDAVSLVRDLLVQFQTCLKDKAKMTVGAGQDKKQIQIVQYLVDKFDNYTKAFGDAN